MRSDKRLASRIMPVLLGAMALLIVACGSAPTQSGTANATQKAPADQQVYRMTQAGISDLQTLDPALTTDLPSATAINLLFTGLVQLDDQLKVQPQLAQSWQESADGLTWTFTLKPNLKFSDGTPLTSQDVVYSIDRALQPATRSSTAASYLGLIKDSDKLLAGKVKTLIGSSLKAPDEKTVVITTNQKASYFLYTLTYPTAYVVQKSMIDKYGKNFTDHLQEGGGAGPFKMQQYTHGKEIVFVPNPNYYGPKPQLQKIIMPFYKDVNTAYKAYQAGQVDIAPVPSTNIEQAKRLSNEFHQTPELAIFYYTMNYLVKPFDNIKIRQAFSLAIDRNRIAESIWKGTRIPTYHIVPQGMPGYNPDLTGLAGVKSTAGDPTKAKQLLQEGLQEMGLSNVSQLPPIRLTYPVGSQDASNEIAAVIQMWHTNLGISVKADPVDFNKLLDQTTAATNNPNGLQFWAIGWIADYPDPQDWLTLQFDKGSPNNNANFGQNNTSNAIQQQAVQQQLREADGNPDQNARMQSYMQAEQQLVNDVAWMSLSQRTATRLLKPYVVGMKFNAQGIFPPDSWANVYIAAH
ncbi:MAG TPA: peptide ABC transporter substrate-binding protein [Ktedonobacteraceae bacterium]|nr:peptide ABC transporter substrate-binding protein [Ktedonobacteraceae bacterium]